MIELFIASSLVAHAISDDAAVALCKPSLAQKAGGEVATISVTSSHISKNKKVIEGRLTAFVGMGPPAPGYASTHHLIRAELTYRCSVSGSRVREARVTPFNP
jgi:hypothetical protein